MAATAITTKAYVEIAADISALTLIQCRLTSQTPPATCVELAAAASQPEATVVGTQVVPGDTITSGNIADIGTSGKLWGKLAEWSPAASILTL